MFLSAGRALTPGNGLFLTSTSTNVTTGYSYGGIASMVPRRVGLLQQFGIRRQRDREL